MYEKKSIFGSEFIFPEYDKHRKMHGKVVMKTHGKINKLDKKKLFEMLGVTETVTLAKIFENNKNSHEVIFYNKIQESYGNNR